MEEMIVAEQEKNIMQYETVALDEQENALVIIDQTKLPGKIELLYLTKQEEIRHILDGVSDLLAADEEAAENTPVTDEDVKNLLKKYSRLSG